MATPLGEPRDRRLALRDDATLNGIDFVKVVTPTRLQVFFLNANPLTGVLTRVEIAGGESVTGIRVTTDVTTASFPVVDGVLTLTLDTDRTGDFSFYTLVLDGDPTKLDRHTARREFSFKADCDTRMDCATPCPICPPPAGELPPIDYLARDFSSFRRALSDFSALRYPDWKERSEADFGMMFMEALCALADDLSYTQERIAWEGKLETATQPVSLQRLARLVDYEPQPATVARVELQLEVGAAGAIPPGMIVLASGPEGDVIPFETGNGLQDAATTPVTPAWNKFGADGLPRINPYWWDDAERCLPATSTEMWVVGHNFGFVAGMRLLIDTAAATTADPPLRQIVTLTENGQEMVDPLFTVLDPVTLTTGPVRLTRLVWRVEDALTADRDLTRTAVAGNIVPATQGQRYGETFAITEAPTATPTMPLAFARIGPSSNSRIPTPLVFRDGEDVPGRPCDEDAAPPAPPIHRYTLGNAPLAYLAPANTGDDATLPTPELTLEQVSSTGLIPWKFRRSLLNALPFEEALYTIDPVRYTVTGLRPPDGKVTDGRFYHDSGRPFHDYDNGDGATLRFGDGTFGPVPADKTVFQVTYRRGGGAVGNVAPDTITRLAPDNSPTLLSLVAAVTNPLPATGGRDAESAESVRRTAPFQFRTTQYRAVRPEDYESAAQTRRFVQRAGTSFRWTGSWLTVFTAADPKNAYALTDDQRLELVALLNRYRMAGYESYIRPPLYAALDIEITVCARAHAFQGDVREAVLNALTGGAGAFFAPDRFTFGVPLERSQLEATIQAQPGVAGVTSIRYRWRGKMSVFVTMPAFVPIGRREIVRVDNDPSRPEFGSVTVTAEGGK